MTGTKKGKKGKHGNKEKVPGEWAVRTLASSPRSMGTAENDSSLEKELTSDSEDKPQLQKEIYPGEKSTSLLLTEFIDRGLEQAGGLALKRTSRNKAVNGVRSPRSSSLSSNDAHSFGCNTVKQDPLASNISGQSSSFSREGKKCDIPESSLAASSRSVPENDQAKVMSDIEVSVEDSSEIDKNCNSSISKEDECKQRDISSVVKQLKNLSLAEPELTETQIEINYQEQEDELLALKAIYGDDIMVFDREDDSPRALKISIHIEIPEKILITVSLAPFSNRCEPSESNDGSSLRENPFVENKYTFSVQHLPPIVLVCVLPKSYPCDMPPQYAILAYWLDSVSIAKLCKCLDNIWFEDSGQVVLYKWAEWLHSLSLSELGFNHEVLLDPYGMKTRVDWRAISGCSTPDVDIPRLMQYNDEKNNEVFRNALHVCNICFNQYPGTEFVKLLCQHIFCWKCMETYSHVHVKDGTVNKLICPDPKCGVSISPALLKRLLGDEAFERWESLLLQKTLDSMEDVVYCPRCEAACLEDEDNHAQCAKCFYSFCSLCRDRRHVGQICMSPEMRLRILQERQSSGRLRTDQKKKEQELINELLSRRKILSDAKQCPRCKMAISKTEGCNKMTCSNCGQYFCYMCSKAISGYEHFSGGGCILFVQEEIQAWERAGRDDRQYQHLVQVELWPHLARSCPSCGQMNAKQGNNNHIFCWSCQNHFCALCRKVVRRSSDHYGPKGCKQHTAD
ncbi:hypothetical protein SUGI_0180480 [Cryptomeria japonica]|uniref:uncharacterized protein LOC131038047 n=1 Tax=Cryptomeria japonica TaxID=3369 RepID=UPI002408E114|nr:uncharacterized protein LOC131038047 [Cryptomeria japonica]GLJ11932.1 hypothetical protein SUGI_0180480 [Cryptomeria japonica]